jgi:type II secretory pathway pseudopilin PulG
MSPCHPCRPASVLLEVLVTVTIIALFMALIGGQILSSVKAADVIQRRQTAMLLAESIYSRLQAGGFELTDQPLQVADTFGTMYPSWGWRVSTETTDDPGLMRVHLEVLRGDPAEPDAPVTSMTAVTDMYTLWALPAQIDPVQDFGLTQAQADELAASGIDLSKPSSLAGIDFASLLKQYPQLAALARMYGIDPSMLATLDEATIKKALEAYLAGGGTIPNLPGGGGGASGSGNAAGGNNPSGGTRGGSGANGNDEGGNRNEQPATGDIDWNYLIQLLNSGDKAAAEDYIRSHAASTGSTPAANNANNANRGGTRAGGRSAGGTGSNRGGSRRTAGGG